MRDSLWGQIMDICDECCEPIRLGQDSVALMLNDTGLSWAHYHRECHAEPAPSPAAGGAGS